ncbi:MAG: RsmB/NOP family class I SAM-dependent RNA methyltransferase [Deltaproteobacteria bacterium]|nr:RsmB/NOP family class I SAM-dependent RNA methyltransferase [Deltaproteobacteria bacterium]
MIADHLRAQAVHALQQIVVDGALANRVVPRVLSGVSSDADRRALKDAIFGCSVMRLRQRFVHGAEIDRWLDDDDDDDATVWPADPIERLEVERSCPRWLVERLVRSLGLAGAGAFLDVSNRPGPVTLRANTLKNDRQQLQETLRAAGVVVVENAISRHAVDVVGKGNLFGLEAWRSGCFEVQDAGSQEVALRSAAQPGDVVVDLCAGRGGKTLALAALMQDRGTLHVHDVDDAALADLRGRLKRAGVGCVQAGLPNERSADVVVVDAPCSSIGVLRRSPDLRFTLQPADVDAVVVVQRALLRQASALVKRGGRVLYATCSVLREENEDVTDVNGGLQIVSRETLLPHVQGCDGFFICEMRKS